jgi:hypothetical protein
MFTSSQQKSVELQQIGICKVSGEKQERLGQAAKDAGVSFCEHRKHAHARELEQRK